MSWVFGGSSNKSPDVSGSGPDSSSDLSSGSFGSGSFDSGSSSSYDFGSSSFGSSGSSSFGGSSGLDFGGGSSLDGEGAQKLIGQAFQQEQQKAMFTEAVSTLADRCWDTCMATPDSKMSSRTETCLGNCVERFIDATLFLTNRLSQKS